MIVRQLGYLAFLTYGKLFCSRNVVKMLQSYLFQKFNKLATN